MHGHSALLSLLYVLSAALLSATILVRFKQPNIIGYLIGGLLIGPHGFALVPYENVELLAEIGIGLLMFTIGIELSISQLLRVKNISIYGGSLIVLLTCAAFIALHNILGLSIRESIVWGFTTGLSSTVVVLKLLSERAELGSTHGNISTGILLYQDVISIPILILIPFLAKSTEINSEILNYLGITVGKLILFLIAVFILGRFLIPRFLKFVAQTHSKELFSISILSLTLGIAALTQQTGLSLALGAFIAGLLVSESDFGNQAASEVLPLKDAFSAVFFVSVGMLLNALYLIENWKIFTLGLAGIISFKFILILITCFIFRYTAKISTFVALCLAQIGEFGFLIILSAKKNEILSEDSYQQLLGISILSIISTPYILKIYPRLKRVFSFMNRTSWINRKMASVNSTESMIVSAEASLTNHVIICGYGPTGSLVAKKLQSLGILTVIVDLNYRVIQELKSNRQHAVYGDSSSMLVLEAAGIQSASLLVVTVPDPSSMQALLKKVRKEFPKIPIFMRVKYQTDRDRLLKLGADLVIWEEFEAGQALLKSAIDHLNIQNAEIS
ncbi:MAG: cation:proton antiporter [Oligoflexia bacterium]|nr:cation:proton antiporter [Oligoflexia bacterium]